MTERLFFLYEDLHQLIEKKKETALTPREQEELDHYFRILI